MYTTIKKRFSQLGLVILAGLLYLGAAPGRAQAQGRNQEIQIKGGFDTKVNAPV